MTGNIGHLSQVIPMTGMIFRETPADYNYSWHNAPRRQFIVNINADVEITVSDGETKVIRQGEVMFLEDTTGVCVCVYVSQCVLVCIYVLGG